MKQAIFTENQQRALLKFLTEWEALESNDYDPDSIREFEPELFRDHYNDSKLEGDVRYQFINGVMWGKSAVIRHLLSAYQCAFHNACDPQAKTLEFKPEIALAMENFPRACELLEETMESRFPGCEYPFEAVSAFLAEVKGGQDA